MIRFSCERASLNDALAMASRVVSGRAAPDGMSKSLLLEVSAGNLTITGSDTDYSLITSIDAEIESGQEGAFLIDAKILSDIVRRLSGEEVSVSVDDQYQAVITSELSEFSIMALSAERYAAVPEVDGTRELSVSQPMLKRLIGLTSFAVSANESRGVHTGVLFDVKPDCLTLVALDGHRMAVADERMENPAEYSFVAHASPVSEVERLLGQDEEQTVSIRVGHRYALFDLVHTRIVARLLEGDFLKYENALPAEYSLSAKVSARAMVQSVERVALLISDKLKNPIRLKFGDGALRMSCATGLGKAYDSLSVESDGELEIGFNHRYLLDALRRAVDDELEMRMSGPLSPMLLLPAENPSYRFLILPVRLNVE